MVLGCNILLRWPMYILQAVFENKFKKINGNISKLDLEVIGRKMGSERR